MKKIRFLLSLALTLTCLSGALASSTTSFIAVSDVHFDPFIGCKLKQHCTLVEQLKQKNIKQWDALFVKNRWQNKPVLLIGKDTNWALLNATFQQLTTKLKQGNEAFVVATGDYIGHDMVDKYRRYFGTLDGYQPFIRKVYQYLIYRFHQAIGARPLYFVMGNNDGYLGDYVINAGGSFFKEAAVDWQPLIGSAVKQPSFGELGNYVVDHDKLRLVVLNSNIFASNTRGEAKQKQMAKTLGWLKQQLEVAKQRHQKIVLFYHIPYGIRPASILLSLGAKPNWAPWFSERFFKLYHDYKENVLGIVHGHVHRPLFMKAQYDKRHPLPQHLIPAISPIFGNKPFFSRVTVEEHSLRVENYPVTDKQPLLSTARKKTSQLTG